MAGENIPQVAGIASVLGSHLKRTDIPHVNTALTKIAELGLSPRQLELVSLASQQIAQQLPADIKLPEHRTELGAILLHTAIICARYDDLQRVYEASKGEDLESLRQLEQIKNMLEGTRREEAFYDIPAGRRMQAEDQERVVTNATLAFAVRYWTEDNPLGLLPAIRTASQQALLILAEKEQQAHAAMSMETYLQTLSTDKMPAKVRDVLTQAPGISPDTLTSMLSLDLLSDQSLRGHLMDFAQSSPRNQANYDLAGQIDTTMTLLSIHRGFFGSEKTQQKTQIEAFIRKTIYSTVLLALARQQGVDTIEELQRTAIIQANAIPQLASIMDIVLPQEVAATLPQNLLRLTQEAIENAYKIAVLFLKERDKPQDNSSDDNGGPGRRGGGGFKPSGNNPTGSGDRSGDLLQVGS